MERKTGTPTSLFCVKVEVERSCKLALSSGTADQISAFIKDIKAITKKWDKIFFQTAKRQPQSPGKSEKKEKKNDVCRNFKNIIKKSGFTKKGHDTSLLTVSPLIPSVSLNTTDSGELIKACHEELSTKDSKSKSSTSNALVRDSIRCHLEEKNKMEIVDFIDKTKSETNWLVEVKDNVEVVDTDESSQISDWLLEDFSTEPVKERHQLLNMPLCKILGLHKNKVLSVNQKIKYSEETQKKLLVKKISKTPSIKLPFATFSKKPKNDVKISQAPFKTNFGRCTSFDHDQKKQSHNNLASSGNLKASEKINGKSHRLMIFK